MTQATTTSTTTTRSLEKLKTVFVGHVDHGKSTLIGRIFHDTDSLPDGKLESIQAACRAEGMDFEFAFLLDALLEEQEQNITIDTTQIQFQTAKREYVIIDAPGHKEFIKNMVTGAANADAAVLLIDASEGVREQSRRHGYLLSMLGISQVAVAVNKMDLVDYSEEVYRRIVKEYSLFLEKLGVEPTFFIPVSAKLGDNIVSPSPNLSWYEGHTIVEALDSFVNPSALAKKTVLRFPLQDIYRFDQRRILAGQVETGRIKVGDELVFSPSALAKKTVLRFPLQDIYRFDHKRILAGQVETGRIKVGDELVFSPSMKTSCVASIERFNGPARDHALAGESIGITLTEQIFVERGNVASHVEDPPVSTNRFQARLFWMAHDTLEKGRVYTLKLSTQEVECELLSIDRVIDADTLEAVETERETINRYDAAEVTLRTRSPLVIDNYDKIPNQGRFVIMAGRYVGGGGIIFGAAYPKTEQTKSTNISWSEGNVTVRDREARNGHRGAMVWLTGLSGSGKSTLSRAIERDLFTRGMQVYVLDGDNIRHGLNSNLGFSPRDRAENIRRVAEVARLMADSGQIVVTAFISPYREDRRLARQIASRGGIDFLEIFVDAPLEVCEQRDPKELYKKARAGEIRQFTGIDAPYEAPESPEITVPTDRMSIDESVAHVLENLIKRLRSTDPASPAGSS